MPNVRTSPATRRRVMAVLLLSAYTVAFTGLVALTPADISARDAVAAAETRSVPTLAPVERERVVARASRDRRVAEAQAAVRAAADAAAAQAAAEAAAVEAAVQAEAAAQAAAEQAAADARAKADAEARAEADAKARADAKAKADAEAEAQAAAQAEAAASVAAQAPSESAKPARPQEAAAAAPASGGTACPVPSASFTDTYGAARSGGRSHQGTDLMAPHGAPAYAVVSGRVRTSSSSLGGISLYLDGDNGETYFYAHNSANVASHGQRVSAGDLVAKVGATGNAAGNSHVHFERQVGGRSVNPYDFLRRVC